MSKRKRHSTNSNNEQISKVHKTDSDDESFFSESDSMDFDIDGTLSEDDTNFSIVSSSLPSPNIHLDDVSQESQDDESQDNESQDDESQESQDDESQDNESQDDESQESQDDESQETDFTSDDYIYDSDNSVQNELIKQFFKSKIDTKK